MKKVSLLLAVLFFLGCGATLKLTKGVNYTMMVGTDMIASKIAFNYGLYLQYCGNPENEQTKEGCKEVVSESNQLCEHISFEYVEKLAASKEDYDFIVEACKSFSEKK